MKIETVIGRFRQAASVSVGALPAQQAASGRAATPAGGRQVTMRNGNSAVNGVQDPPICSYTGRSAVINSGTQIRPIWRCHLRGMSVPGRLEDRPPIPPRRGR